MAVIRRYGANVTLESAIPDLQQDMVTKLASVVERTARIVHRGAMIRSRVDTGQMRAGWRVQREALYEWMISNAVLHTIFNEFGTRYMSAQPMLIPSVESADAMFRAAIAAVFRQGRI